MAVGIQFPFFVNDGQNLVKWRFLLDILSNQYRYKIKVYNLLQVRSEKTLKLSESHFNVVLAVRNLLKIEYIPKQTLSKLDTDYSLENGGFCKWRGFGQTKNQPFSRFYCTSRGIRAVSYQSFLLHKNRAFYYRSSLIWVYQEQLVLRSNSRTYLKHLISLYLVS